MEGFPVGDHYQEGYLFRDYSIGYYHIGGCPIGGHHKGDCPLRGRSVEGYLIGGGCTGGLILTVSSARLTSTYLGTYLDAVAV